MLPRGAGEKNEALSTLPSKYEAALLPALQISGYVFSFLAQAPPSYNDSEVK